MSTSPPCPSDFALERWLLGELPRGAAEVAEHIEVCDACRAKIDAKTVDTADFMSSPVADDVRRALAERTSAQSGSAVPEPPRSHAPRAGALFRAHRFLVARRSVLALVAAAIAVVVSFALSHRHPPVAQTTAAGATPAEAEVLGFQRAWMEAVRDKDAAALDRILADDYTYTDTGGRVTTKADSLRQARGTGRRLKAFQTSDEKARVYGDTAIITGRLRVEGMAGGEPFETEVRFTDVLARIGGEWRAVAAHASKL